ncbi:hypothetical protein SCATT_p05200 (plasmid) [Streptantibioticus cattleyicolor NRRL 8057 = DSM 46488]|uniref:diacylglycerol O-acyltransferase n=2 Tax=Streptantibioticus cattleyicolor TaxID=29303 RepID=F8JJG3_STREN|nr:hypothetical protein SCATT_p05200 [Streptantibioticus cattleyicolor NRRL 8057 = DSM 46488]CCB72233.1 putative Diacylglycerol O-acyltransferase [Streptantibioticus cattleyicolor NRRL 8057 = DSM 46488]
MTPKDRLVWRLETDTDIRPIIVLLFLLDGEVTTPAVVEWHRSACAVVPRLAARVVTPRRPGAGPRWEPDPHFDPARHVLRVALPGKGTRAELLSLVEELVQTPFVPGRPLWQCYLVDGVEGGRTGYVLKISHTIADGLRLRELFLHQSAQARMLGGVKPGGRGNGAGGRGRRTAEALRFCGQVARDMADPPGRPRGTGDGVARRFHTVDLPMARLREIARGADGSVQDVLVAGLTEGCRRYYQHRGVHRPVLTVFSPYGRAPLTRDDPSPMGNHWFIIRFPVPLCPGDPAARVRAARAAVREVYHRGAPDWMGAVARVSPAVPGRWLQTTFRRFSASHDFIISNIPGPRRAIQVAGATVTEIYGIAPTLGAALTATTVSYGGTCHVVLSIDPFVVPDPAVFADCLRGGLEEVTAGG